MVTLKSFVVEDRTTKLQVSLIEKYLTGLCQVVVVVFVNVDNEKSFCGCMDDHRRMDSCLC